MRLPLHIHTKAARWALTASALALVAATTGCGGSTSSTPATSAARSTPSTPAPAPASTTSPQRETAGTEHLATATLQVTIPGLIGTEHQIPTRNTCDGQDTSLPMRWSNVPHDTVQIAIFIISLQPVKGKFYFNWAITGINPTTHAIPAGKLPPGAIVGTNSSGKTGYTICPSKGTHEIYAIRVTALPRSLPAHPGFDPEAYYREAQQIAKNVGIDGASYTRP